MNSAVPEQSDEPQDETSFLLRSAANARRLVEAIAALESRKGASQEIDLSARDDAAGGNDQTV
jgi:hypothetical protein